MAALGAQSSSAELLQVLTDVYRSFLGRFGPEPSCRDVAVLISSGLSVRKPGGDRSWELVSMSLSLVKKLPAESELRWKEVLRVLLEDLGLMSQLVQLLGAEDQLVSHLAAKTTSVCVLHLLRTSGDMSPEWQETCVQTFSRSWSPAELDPCLWTLTQVLKDLLKGPDPGTVGGLVSQLEPGLRILWSKLIPEHKPEPEPGWTGLTFRRSWKTTFCLLLDLLEVLAACGSVVGPEVCQRPVQVQFSALLAAVSVSQGFVQDRVLLLLKRVLLQGAGDDWSLGGLKSRDLDLDLRGLAHSVLAAVTRGWLQTVQVEPGHFFGGTRPVPGDQDQKPGGVTLRAVGLVLLRSTEVHVQTLDPAGGDSVSQVCGHVHRLWDFLERFRGSLRVRHLCCWIHVLFEDQDDDLMEALRTCLSLFLVYRRCLDLADGTGADGTGADGTGTVLKRACASGFNPHCHFVLLLHSVSFDHSVLLDFLISSETCFLEYFIRYLKYLRGSWPGFTAACGSRTITQEKLGQDGLSTRISEHVHLLDGPGPGPTPRLVDYDSSDESGTEPAEDSAGPEPETPKPEILQTCPGDRAVLSEDTLDRAVLSEDTLDRAVLCPSEDTLDRAVLSEDTLDRAVLSEDTLDRAVLCLAQLQQVVMRLQKKHLFPYDPSSLLKLLTQVETLYRRSQLSSTSL